MAPTIDQMVEQAYKLIDGAPDYMIPRLIQWKKTHRLKIGKKLSACIGCGKPIVHNLYRDIILRCPDCRKKVSELFQKRKSSFCKNSTIETHL